MKTLFVIPPQWYPMNPYLSGAQLVGQLKAKGFDAKTRDLNIEFFNDILNKENVISAANKAEKFYNDFLPEFSAGGYCEEYFDTYSRKLQTKILRLMAYQEFLESGIKVEEVAENIEDAVSVIAEKGADVL